MVGEIHSSPERYAKNCSVVFRKGHTTECAWKVSAQEIVARNYNLDGKNPHEVEVNYRNPEELMQEYLEIPGPAGPLGLSRGPSQKQCCWRCRIRLYLPPN